MRTMIGICFYFYLEVQFFSNFQILSENKSKRPEVKTRQGRKTEEWKNCGNPMRGKNGSNF